MNSEVLLGRQMGRWMNRASNKREALYKCTSANLTKEKTLAIDNI